MNRKIILLSVMAFFSICRLKAQQPFDVSDSVPITVNGLEMGYHIKSAEEKEVSDKGNFSRYSVQFYITNTTTEAKIILYKEGWNILGNVSDYLVRFDCLNATGARFTSKGATLEAAPCNILADVEDKDCSSGKTTHSKKFVQIGYWIKARQTISTSTVMIVPLNEMPKMTAAFLMNSVSSMASAQYGQPGAGINDIQSFSKVRNIWKNTYLNNQNGALVCTGIDNGWWSAQWQLIPVSGTNLFNIKNKWKNNYISLDESGAVTVSLIQSNIAMWQLERVQDSNAFRLKNVANNTYLNIENGTLQSTKIWDTALSAQWIFEPAQ